MDGADRLARLVEHAAGRITIMAGGKVRVQTAALAKGKHTLRLQVSDYQETRNMENVGSILPNTRILTTAFVVS